MKNLIYNGFFIVWCAFWGGVNYTLAYSSSPEDKNYHTFRICGAINVICLFIFIFFFVAALKRVRHARQNTDQASTS